MQELENRKLARIGTADVLEGEIPYQVTVWTDAVGPVLDGWDTFREELRSHLAGRADTALDDVIAGPGFSLPD